MTALITIKTFNGHNINDITNYVANDIGGAFTTPNSAKPGWVTESKADQVYSGNYTVDIRTMTIAIKINGSDKNTLANQLRYWFKRGTYGNLVATFSDDSTDYYLPCVVTSLVSSVSDSYTGDYVVSLQTSTTSWIAVTASTDTWSYVPVSGTSKTITVGGTDETRLIANITPTGNPAAGYLYHSLYKLVNITTSNYGGMYPHCMTVDTATLVSAGKMLSSCNDLRVFVNNRQVNRWIVNENTATTKVWFNVALNPGFILPGLSAAIGINDSLSTIRFKTTYSYWTTYLLKKLPASGIIVIDNEYFTYSKYVPVGGGGIVYYVVFTLTARGVLGSTKAAHSANSNAYYVQNVINMVYGNSTDVAPSDGDSNYDLRKPLFNLKDSDNTKWVYDATSSFYNPTKPGTWVVSTKRGIGSDRTCSYNYVSGSAADSGNDDAMGAKISSYLKGGVWQTETASIAWTLNHPAGFTKISSTGNKRRNMTNWVGSLNTPTFIAGLQKGTTSAAFTNVWSQASPTSKDGWASWTASSSAVNSPYFRFFTSGSLPVPDLVTKTAGSGCENHFEVLTAAAEFTSANLPATNLFSAVTSHVQLAGTLANTTNLDAVDIDYPMEKDKTFVFDSENSLATYEGASTYGSIDLNDESRSTWIGLLPGENVLTLSSGSLGNTTLALSWHKRRI